MLDSRLIQKASAVVLVLIAIVGAYYLQESSFGEITIGSSENVTTVTLNPEEEFVEKVQSAIDGEDVPDLIRTRETLFCLKGENVCGLYNQKTGKLTVASGNINNRSAKERIEKLYEKRR